MKLVIEPASAILLHSLMPALAFQWAILEQCVATCMISKCCHYKMAGLNLSTHHEVGDWASICHHPFAFLDASPGLSMGHFGIVCGYLYDFQVLPLQNGWPEPFNPAWNWWLGQHLPFFGVEIAGEAGYSTQSPIWNWVGGLKLATW